MTDATPGAAPHTEADIHLIQRIIPHRYPFLMIDRVRDIVPHRGAVGIKNVTFNEPHFTGHFPDAPIMPGVLVVEAMAQTAAVVVGILLYAVLGKLADVLAKWIERVTLRWHPAYQPGAKA